MTIFSHKSCIALSWTKSGICHGVHLRRKGDSAYIHKYLSSGTASNEQLSEKLAEFYKKLDARSDTIVIIGREGLSCGFADLTLPNLTPSETHNALEFQLSQLSPISSDKLVWGYRTIPSSTKDEKLIRLAYMRSSEWNQWLDNASNLGKIIDLMIPPIITLDPLFDNEAVLFNNRDNNTNFASIGSNQGREITYNSAEFANIAFGNPDNPLKSSLLDIKELEQETIENQRDYCEVALLGMYGLSKSCTHDKTTWLPLPYELKTKRHQLSKTVAICATIFLAFIIATGAYKNFRAKQTYLKNLDVQIAKTDKQINTYLDNPDEYMELVKELEAELTANKIEYPPMPDCLLELTQLLESNKWINYFSWKNSWVFPTIQIRVISSEPETALAKLLEESIIFKDATVGRSSRTSSGYQTYYDIKVYPKDPRFSSEQINNNKTKAPVIKEETKKDDSAITGTEKNGPIPIKEEEDKKINNTPKIAPVIKDKSIPKLIPPSMPPIPIPPAIKLEDK